MARALLAALIAIAVALPVASWATQADEVCALYLEARERLAPAEVSSRRAFDAVVSAGTITNLEFEGDISAMACVASAAADQPSRMLIVTLDDGWNVTLRAREDVDALRVGDRVAAIASLQRAATSTTTLVVEGWAWAWDLPPRDGDEPLDAPARAPAVRVPAPAAPVTPGAQPGTSATLTFPVDAIAAWRAWVLEHNSRLSEQQAENIVRWVLEYAAQYDVNHKLIFALIKWESWFDPTCVSHSGAYGLCQLMPGTARYMGVDPRSVQQNIQGGVRYLSEQLATYAERPNGERVALALACYNAGPNAVKRAGHRIPAITETRRYVRKVTTTFRELHEAGMP